MSLGRPPAEARSVGLQAAGGPPGADAAAKASGPSRRSASLRWRLSSLFALLALAGLGLVSGAIYAAAGWHLARKAEAELGRKTELVHRLVAEATGSGDLAALRHKLDEFFVVHEDLQVRLFDAAGTVVYQGPVPPGHGPSREAAFDLPPAAATQGLARARIALDREDDARLLSGLATLLLAASLAGAAVVSASGFWLVRRALAPLRGLAEQTRALRADRLDQRLALDPPVQELQPWIDQFNALLGRLEQAYCQLEAFNADVAHELRTPLANLMARTEVELSRQRSPEELRDTLGANLEEVRRLSSIVGDMLFLARADRGAQARMAAPSSLAVEVRQVLEFHEGALADKQLRARTEGDAWAAFEAGLLRRALSNLLDNAVRHAGEGSEIVVALHEQDGQAWIEVRNRGAEVPAEALPRLFDRFFRVERAREGSHGHHGLGLAIVSAIARMHGGGTRASCGTGMVSIGFSVAAAHRH